MKEIVRRIFGDEAAEDPDIVRFYEEVNKDVAKEQNDLYVLVELQNKYIELLGNELSNSAVFLHTHGISSSNEAIEKGKQLRGQIKEIKDKLYID